MISEDIFRELDNLEDVLNETFTNKDINKSKELIREQYGTEVYDLLEDYIEDGGQLDNTLFTEKGWDLYCEWLKDNYDIVPQKLVEDGEIAKAQSTDVNADGEYEYDETLMKVVKKSLELSKALSDKYGWDVKLVFADFMRDIHLMLNPNEFSDLDMSQPINVLTKGAYDEWVRPALELNDLFGGALMGQMIDNYLELTPQDAINQLEYLMHSNPQQLPRFIRDTLPMNNNGGRLPFDRRERR